jgi:hypothetical protein
VLSQKPLSLMTLGEVQAELEYLQERNPTPCDEKDKHF